MAKVPPICLLPDGVLVIFKFTGGIEDGCEYRSDQKVGLLNIVKVYWNSTHGGQIGKEFYVWSQAEMGLVFVIISPRKCTFMK